MRMPCALALRMPPFSPTLWVAKGRVARRCEGSMISGQQSASWWDAEALIRRLAANEEEVRRGFWRKLRQLVSQLPFAEDLVTAHYCAFDRQTPTHVRAALIGALAYFVLPTDGVPDVLPLIGYTDDAALL